MRRSAIIMFSGLAALGVAACTHPGGYGQETRYGYAGGEWDGPRGAYSGPLHGPGVATLDPWLTETAEGRAIVTLGFRDAGRGFVDDDVAHRANIWFRRYADSDGDMRITDPEIRVALVAAAGRYLR